MPDTWSWTPDETGFADADFPPADFALTPTPGHIAYAAYHQGSPLPWDLLPAYEQHNWEAAAQAVLALKQEEPRGT